MPLRAAPPPAPSQPSQVPLLLWRHCWRSRPPPPASEAGHARGRDDAGWQAAFEGQGSDEGGVSVGAREGQTGLLALPLNVRALKERWRRATRGREGVGPAARGEETGGRYVWRVAPQAARAALAQGRGYWGVL